MDYKKFETYINKGIQSNPKCNVSKRIGNFAIMSWRTTIMQTTQNARIKQMLVNAGEDILNGAVEAPVVEGVKPDQILRVEYKGTEQWILRYPSLEGYFNYRSVHHDGEVVFWMALEKGEEIQEVGKMGELDISPTILKIHALS